MTTTRDIAPGAKIDLRREVVGIAFADRRARLVEQAPGRPPRRIEGFTVGASEVAGDPPHGGEMHPDGDELLFLVSGAVTVTLELPEGTAQVELDAGEALVVPQGTWHQVTTRRPGQLLHVTPGPGGRARPRADAAGPG